MKIYLNSIYRTNWGESLYVSGNIAALGNEAPDKAPIMKLNGKDCWSLELDIPDDIKDFNYRYFVRHENGTVKNEWGKPHKFLAGAAINDVHDRWQDQPFDKPYYASAFTDCICRRNETDHVLAPASGKIMLAISAPMINPAHTLAVSGASDSLGQWNPEKAVRMNNSDFPIWKVNIPAGDNPVGTEYKFLIIDKESGAPVSWEGGENRRIEASSVSTATILAGMRFINEQKLWRGAGVAIPVFSLRSADDFGVGDFYDIVKLVDWAVATGQTFIQVLPVNDTTMTGTWTDSYPYNANSTFALHPMYLRVDELGKPADPARTTYFENLRKELNALTEVDYERANNAKIEYTRAMFAQEGKKTLASKEFKAFFKKNSGWLTPYAAFCTLRDRFHTPDFNKWEKYADFSKIDLGEFSSKHADDMNYVYYVQYHLDRQLHNVRDYAHAHGVTLKGDIPIGISRTSADAWTNPRLFNLNSQAGAPPDDFSVLGQNWGLPTYNWEEMSRDGFKWWKDRFRKMAEYFDAYRIDHVLGFFRIWQIPMDAIHGLLGVFNPALPFTPDELRYNYDFWIDTDLHTTPYIMDYFVGDYFGPYTAEACKNFMDSVGHGRYRLKEDFNTQRKIADYFAKQAANEKNSRLCDGLIGLVDNVLFIEDPYEKGKYHPRISAQYTYIYRSLNDYERWCFDRLYNDFYYHRHNDFWYDKAMWKLPPLIDSNDMLVCAEDLGMIPACVPAVMSQLEILSLEIQRMPKDPSTEFGNTWNYPYYSVCTTSTHDMDGIRRWWESDRDRTQHFFNEVLHENGQAPYFAEPWVCDKIVDLHLKSPSMLCILPLQDWLSLNGEIRRENPAEELINNPAITPHYWRYRMHLSIEELLGNKEFNNYLHDKIKESGR